MVHVSLSSLTKVAVAGLMLHAHLKESCMNLVTQLAQIFEFAEAE